jgi:hypothetical protein
MPTRNVLVVFKNSENTPVSGKLVGDQQQLGSVLSSFAKDQKIDLEHYEFWDEKGQHLDRLQTLRLIVGDAGKRKLIVHFAQKCRDELIAIERKREEDLLEAETHCQLIRYEITKHTIQKMKAQVWIRNYRKLVAAAELRFKRKRARWLNTDWCTCELLQKRITHATKSAEILIKDLKDTEQHMEAMRARLASGSLYLDVWDRSGLGD